VSRVRRRHGSSSFPLFRLPELEPPSIHAPRAEDNPDRQHIFDDLVLTAALTIATVPITPIAVSIAAVAVTVSVTIIAFAVAVGSAVAVSVAIIAVASAVAISVVPIAASSRSRRCTGVRSGRVSGAAGGIALIGVCGGRRVG
jgi:hypothetical protein